MVSSVGGPLPGRITSADCNRTSELRVRALDYSRPHFRLRGGSAARHAVKYRTCDKVGAPMARAQKGVWPGQ